LPKIEVDFKSSCFEELVIEAIDQTFSKLGIEVKQTFFSFLEVNYKLCKEDIPNRIGDFVDGLEQIFGASAPLLELVVMKTLRQSVPSFIYLVESSNLNFESYLSSLKHHVENL
jgi:hypothetical protein